MLQHIPLIIKINNNIRYYYTLKDQASAALISQRDSVMGTNTAAKRESRRSLPSPEIAPGADAWQNGPAFQIPD